MAEENAYRNVQNQDKLEIKTHMDIFFPYDSAFN
jgi:hypothetical protein